MVLRCGRWAEFCRWSDFLLQEWLACIDRHGDTVRMADSSKRPSPAWKNPREVLRSGARKSRFRLFFKSKISLKMKRQCRSWLFLFVLCLNPLPLLLSSMLTFSFLFLCLSSFFYPSFHVAELMVTVRGKPTTKYVCLAALCSSLRSRDLCYSVNGLF